MVFLLTNYPLILKVIIISSLIAYSPDHIVSYYSTQSCICLPFGQIFRAHCHLWYPLSSRTFMTNINLTESRVCLSRHLCFGIFTRKKQKRKFNPVNFETTSNPTSPSHWKKFNALGWVDEWSKQDLTGIVFNIKSSCHLLTSIFLK